MNAPERSARGALRNQLDKMNALGPMKPDDVPGLVLYWRVLVEPFVPKHQGMIETPEIIEQAERIQSSVGRILQLGHFAFKSRTAAGLDLAEQPNLPQVGDYVLHEIYAGQAIKLRNERSLRVLNDTEILMVISDPQQIRGYL